MPMFTKPVSGLSRHSLWVLCLAAILGCSCGGSATGGDSIYPYTCKCSCVRCVQHDLDAGSCLAQERQSFPSAVCAVSIEAAALGCASSCAAFGTSCTSAPGQRAETSACPNDFQN